MSTISEKLKALEAARYQVDFQARNIASTFEDEHRRLRRKEERLDRMLNRIEDTEKALRSRVARLISESDRAENDTERAIIRAHIASTQIAIDMIAGLSDV